MGWIVDSRFVLVAQTEIDGKPAVHFPVVLEIHAVEFNVRVRGGTADHLRCSVERTQQEGRKLTAVVQSVWVIESLRGDGRRKIEVRCARHVRKAVAAPLLESCFEVMRTPLLRDLDV